MPGRGGCCEAAVGGSPEDDIASDFISPLLSAAADTGEPKLEWADSSRSILTPATDVLRASSTPPQLWGVEGAPPVATLSGGRAAGSRDKLAWAKELM